MSSKLTGFNDESIAAYVEELKTLSDYNILVKACKSVSNSWTEARRPPIAVILAAYNREVARVQSESMPRGIGQRYPTFAEGIEIAWQAYCAEVRRQGREPDRRKFEKWLPV